MKVALLSNINIDPLNRKLSNTENEIYNSRGYGNELGVMLNKESTLYSYKPEIIFVLIDIMELIHHNIEIKEATNYINEWFALVEGSIKEEIIYYITDAYLYGFEMKVVWGERDKEHIENIWNEKLYRLMSTHSNIRIFPYNSVVRKLGEKDAFSNKMWYMGKILHSNLLQKVLFEEIKHKIEVEKRQPKKVLLLDLDNTLWRGLAGENDINPIVLSEDGVGLAYKNFQRAIKYIKKQGVVLGIVSKNNEDDALNIIDNHPHMVLRREDFATQRINWDNKADNIASIAKELNIGLDSIVFIDDNKAEQTLVKEMLPQVCVPKFPDNAEELTDFITEIYHKYFEKPVVTSEDANKTEQYKLNLKRMELQKSSVDYNGYLDSLKMKMQRVDPIKNKERLLQLMNKTNQFNLTTKRFTEQELSEILHDEKKEVFLYDVSDKFGDNGIVAAVIVEYSKEAVIIEFTMSCRVMGRKIEDAIIKQIETTVKNKGYNNLVGLYKPTEKNKPVENLYTSFGYKIKKTYDNGIREYSYDLNDELKRDIHVDIIRGEEYARKNHCPY